MKKEETAPLKINILKRIFDGLCAAGFVVLLLIIIIWSHPRGDFDDDTV
ncbi:MULTISPECIES: hypothetical protein [Cupriavidus]